MAELGEMAVAVGNERAYCAGAASSFPLCVPFPITPLAPSPKSGKRLCKFHFNISDGYNGFCSSMLSKQTLLKPGLLHFD